MFVEKDGKERLSSLDIITYAYLKEIQVNLVDEDEPKILD